MPTFFTNQKIKKGTAPGSLIFVGEQKMEAPIIKMMQYNDKSSTERELSSIEEAVELLNGSSKTWINIDGVHEEKLISTFGSALGLNPLLLEDIMDTTQRPKCEAYDSHEYIVLRMIRYDEQRAVTISEQISMVLGSNYLFTFQEITGDVLSTVRDRIRKAKTRIRTRSADYLAYAIIDTIVDHYIYTIEQFGEKIEEIDQDVILNPSSEILEKINYYKREINYLRKVIRPVREIIIQLDKSDLSSDETKPFLKDLLDHVTHSTEAIETYRELLSDQLNIYHTSMSSKLNDIIKLLTIYSVIFIPLTFLAGIYGMNFKYLPELDYPYAYPIFWGVMILISVSMILYFKKRNWL